MPSAMQRDCNIAEFYSTKSVAITGATGFIGQLLVEKLLRSCPKLDKIFLLIRNKKGITSRERLHNMLKLPIFDSLRTIQPEFSSKLIAVACDLSQSDLGLNEASLTRIQNDVNIFFHCAATVRFNEHLRLSYDVNCLAVRRMLQVCRNIKNLTAIVHVSTAYSQCNRSLIEEKIYPTGLSIDKLQDALQWMTDDMIVKITPDIVQDRPNTYTLTKALGEELIEKEGIGLPVCIVRPSIVCSTYQEPLQGWCFNLNGPTGIVIAAAKGLLNYLLCLKQSSLDIVPADRVVNGIIAAAWETGWQAKTFNPQMKLELTNTNNYSLNYPDDVTSNPVKTFAVASRSQPNHIDEQVIPIYNLVANTGTTLTVSTLFQKLIRLYQIYPCDDVLRLPFIKTVSNKFLYNILTFVFEYIPAYLYDLGLLCTGRKPSLLRVLKRVTSAADSLSYFHYNQWEWKDENSQKLWSVMSDADRKIFNFNSSNLNWDVYLKAFCLGTRQYVLREDPRAYPIARRRVQRLRVLGWILQLFTFALIWRVVISRTLIAKRLWHFLLSYWFRLLRFLSRFALFV